MPKDIRDILKEAQGSRELKENHRLRFEERLQQLDRPKKKSNFFFLKIAASIMLIATIGYFSLPTSPVDLQEQPFTTTKIISLSSVSPEMKQIEDYYVTAINYELASIDITPDNQEMLDDYLEKIGKLTDDYQRLNVELSKKGINEKTINALITNLQLRLQLLVQLKDTINEMKTSKNKENENITI
jgi:hypothetical protein